MMAHSGKNGCKPSGLRHVEGVLLRWVFLAEVMLCFLNNS
jgi:hypothetical protein